MVTDIACRGRILQATEERKREMERWRRILGAPEEPEGFREQLSVNKRPDKGPGGPKPSLEEVRREFEWRRQEIGFFGHDAWADEREKRRRRS